MILSYVIMTASPVNELQWYATIILVGYMYLKMYSIPTCSLREKFCIFVGLRSMNFKQVVQLHYCVHYFSWVLTNMMLWRNTTSVQHSVFTWFYVLLNL
jgi:hypothetical protein